MKKLIAWVLALLMLGSTVAFAEMPDFSAMTDAELHEIVDGARSELKERELKAEKDTVLVDQDGVKVYLTGKYEINDYSSSSGNVYIRLEAVIINNTDKTIDVFFDSATVNGWDVDNCGIGEITARHKKKDEFELTISDAEISTYEEIEEIEIKLYIYDDDAYERMFVTDPITLHFN